MSHPIPLLLPVVATFLACFALPASAGDTPERVIDQNLLSLSRINIDCDLTTYAHANECVRRVLPTVAYRSDVLVAHWATHLLRVKFKTFPDANNANKPMESVGSAFLVDRSRGYFLTAKHVMMGKKVWSTHFGADQPFGDLETAIEDFLYSTNNVEITLQLDEDMTPVPASLIALDRNSDLALIAVRNPNLIQTSQYPALFRELPLAQGLNCPSLTVLAIGFSESPDAGKFERKSSGSKFESASCDFFPKTYYIGGRKYRIALFRTEAPFQSGFSGGPVLNSDLRVVGVVSGATVTQADRTNSFFVPLPAIQSFVSRFR